MTLDFGKQIAFKGGSTRKGTFKKQDLGHNAYIQRMREQLDLTNYKEVVAKTTKAAKDTFSVIQSNQVKQLNNKREIDQFELKKLDTAAQATEQVAKQWDDYGDEEIAQIERDAESLSGLYEGLGELAMAAGGVLVAREQNLKAKGIEQAKSETLYSSYESAFPLETRKFKHDLDNNLRYRSRDFLEDKKGNVPDNYDPNNDSIAQLQKEAKAQPGHLLTVNGQKLAQSLHKAPDTFNSIKLEIKDDIIAKGWTDKFSDKQINDIARVLTLRAHGAEGVYSPEANALRDVLLGQSQVDENTEFARKNKIQSEAIWDTNVDDRLSNPVIGIEDVEEVLANITKPNTLLFHDGARLQGKEAVTYVLEKLVDADQLDLAHDLLTQITPTKDGKVIPGKNSWLEVFPKLGDHLKTYTSAGHNLEVNKQSVSTLIEGEKLYRSIDENWDLTPDHPDYEGSGAQLYQQYLNGDKEPFREWTNTQLNLLKPYPEHRDRFSSMIWAETWSDPALATQGDLINFAIKDQNWELLLSQIKNLSKTKQLEYLNQVDEFDAMRPFYNFIEKRKGTESFIVVTLNSESAYRQGRFIEGLEEVTNRYEAQRIELVRTGMRSVDDGGQGLPGNQAMAWAQKQMDEIFTNGIKDPASPYYIIPSDETDQTTGKPVSKLGNVYRDRDEGAVPPNKIIDTLTNIFVPRTGLSGVTAHSGDDMRAFISDPSSAFNSKNGTKLSQFWEPDLNYQAKTIEKGGTVRLTDSQREVYDGIKYRIPGYTETQFLSDVLRGQGFNVTSDGMSTKDIVSAGSVGEKTTKLITNATTNAKLHKINLYTKAVNNNLRPATTNQAARNALAIDYTGSVHWDEHPYYSKKDQEAQGYLYRMSSDIDVNPQNLLDSLNPFSDEIHGLHLNGKSIVCKEGTEECEWANKNMNKSTSVDWKIPGGTTNDSWFYLPK
jgi:hypothetical protein